MVLKCPTDNRWFVYLPSIISHPLMVHCLYPGMLGKSQNSSILWRKRKKLWLQKMLMTERAKTQRYCFPMKVVCGFQKAVASLNLPNLWTSEEQCPSSLVSCYLTKTFCCGYLKSYKEICWFSPTIVLNRASLWCHKCFWHEQEFRML